MTKRKKTNKINKTNYNSNKASHTNTNNRQTINKTINKQKKN